MAVSLSIVIDWVGRVDADVIWIRDQGRDGRSESITCGSCVERRTIIAANW